LTTYRLREFVNPADGHSLIVDTSAGMVFGVRPGLEHFAAAVQPILPCVDGIVTGPGQARTLMHRTRDDAALLIRADWTNVLRGEDFVLPPESVQYVSVLDTDGVLDLGGSAAVIHFLLGYTEDVEAACLKRTVTFALTGAQRGLPLIVDVHPTGPRVVLPNKAIELGTSYAIEGGASGVVIPWPGAKSFESIRVMTEGMPVWIKPAALDPAGADVTEALAMGAAGLWLGDDLFAAPDPVGLAQTFRALVHAAQPIPQGEGGAA
jgi:2-amino-4,5-dihydroxy-6-oxo-7-(phosphonooxy)heptanoate synthase